MWLLDARDKLQDARLDGLDISFDAAPPHETLPTNMTLCHWNVKDGFPEDLVGTYDIVHVWSFSFFLLNDEAFGVVKKLLPEILSEDGFVEVDRDTRDAPPHLAFLFHEAGLRLAEQIARNTKSQHVDRELEKIPPVAVEETRQGAYGAGLRYTVIGGNH
ncbi:putative Methyltransferase domain-containing protein [Seiridium cardinale]|uniref:Methyltransferase domain-containing protein n=1 Tax=Seiridium cardinale TaxID=138064 RepID=A0ABR2XDQ9_9PEZI